MIASLAILSVAVMGMAILADNFSRDTKGNVTSSQMRTFGEASKAYIKDNYAAIQAIATSTSPALIDVSTLIAAGKLPTGFLAANAYGQSMCTLVLEPAANRLQAMVIAEGGATIEDLALGSIASTIGGSGGGVYATAATTMRGAIGGWSLPTSTADNLVNNVSRHCDGTAGNVRVAAGHPLMALWFENGDTSAAFLSKDLVVNRPDLNTMTTPLVMGSVQTLSAACTQTGAVAQDGTGALISCQAGIWAPAASSSGSKCVFSTDDLNNMQTDGRCFNGSNQSNSPAGADWIFTEVYRHVNAGNYYVAQRVVGMTGASVGRVWQRNQQSATQWNGWSAWVQQADSQVSMGPGGTLTAAGAVTAKQGNFSGDGTGTCCASTAALTVSELSYITGRLPSIQFHAAGQAEGRIELDGSGTINLKNNGGSKIGLRAGATNVDSLTSSGNINNAGDINNSGSISNAGTINSSGTINGNSDLNIAGKIFGKSSIFSINDDWALLGYGAGYNANAQPKGPIGSAYLNDVYLRSIGKWSSQMTSSATNMQTFSANGSISWTNNLGVNARIYAYGGTCGANTYDLNATLNGTLIQGNTDNNQSWAKSTSLTFDVSPGWNAQLSSNAYGCGPGQINIVLVW